MEQEVTRRYSMQLDDDQDLLRSIAIYALATGIGFWLWLTVALQILSQDVMVNLCVLPLAVFGGLYGAIRIVIRRTIRAARQLVWLVNLCGVVLLALSARFFFLLDSSEGLSHSSGWKTFFGVFGIASGLAIGHGHGRWSGLGLSGAIVALILLAPFRPVPSQDSPYWFIYNEVKPGMTVEEVDRVITQSPVRPRRSTDRQVRVPAMPGTVAPNGLVQYCQGTDCYEITFVNERVKTRQYSAGE